MKVSEQWKAINDKQFQLLEEESNDSHETYEQYRGANLTELSVSLATAIKNEAPSIYATLI